MQVTSLHNSKVVLIGVYCFTDMYSPKTLQAIGLVLILVGPFSKRITCWVHETQLVVKMSVPH